MHEQTLKKNHLYREAVSSFFALHGHPDAQPVFKNKPKDLKPGQHGHISGLHDFEIVCSAATTSKPSEGLAQAQEAAEAQGKSHAALILSRPNRGIDESYAIVSLGTLAALIRHAPEVDHDDAD